MHLFSILSVLFPKSRSWHEPIRFGEASNKSGSSQGSSAYVGCRTSLHFTERHFTRPHPSGRSLTAHLQTPLQSVLASSSGKLFSASPGVPDAFYFWNLESYLIQDQILATSVRFDIFQTHSSQYRRATRYLFSHQWRKRLSCLEVGLWA